MSPRRPAAPASRRPSTATRAEFLLEIGCEEIPAWMIVPACGELKALLEKYLNEAALLDGSSIEVFGGPRRLTAVIPGLRCKQADVVREITGPAKAVAYDAQGHPTRAAEGFAASKGASVKDLFVVKLPKGEFVAVRQVTRGRTAETVLAKLLPRALAEIPWPKTMRWPAKGSPRFIRPVRWIVALLSGRVVPFEFGGAKSGARTDGHRFLGKRGILVRGAADYRAHLRRNFVLVGPEERRKRIADAMVAVAATRRLSVLRDDDLLDRVTYLNEFPSAILGSFDPAFLSLPEEILITVMRDHQKYFALRPKSSGGLAPHFLAIINSDRDRAGKMRLGHERVLRARFADAKFFWDSDQVKCRLADNLPKLDAITYEASLGSYGLKVKRMRSLARAISTDVLPAVIASGLPRHQAMAQVDIDSIDRAVSLCKCDLVTEMVREFSELQGVVGGLYAKEQGEPDRVARAIYDQYLPAGLEDQTPSDFIGCFVALADKLDALAANFAVGKAPSGSSDPFALRRAAIGVVRILVERNLPLPLRRAVDAAISALREHNPGIKLTSRLGDSVLDFLADRARFYFQERCGHAFDEVKAAMSAGFDDLIDLRARLEALQHVRPTQNFPPLAAAFKRIRNILEKSAAKESIPEVVDPARFTTDEEHALHAAAQGAARAAAEFKRARKYAAALERIAALRPAVDLFFDKVLVMAPEPEVRANRLALLRNLLREFSTIADFSEIVTESTAQQTR
jgi:glycyl-tRNA synthetase beta chain